MLLDNLSYKPNMTLVSKEAVEAAHGGSMMNGGHWRPCDCKAKYKLALIIPFRDRHEHLYVFLNNIIPFLQYQKRHFRIFVVEQVLINYIFNLIHLLIFFNCKKVNSLFLEQ